MLHHDPTLLLPAFSSAVRSPVGAVRLEFAAAQHHSSDNGAIIRNETATDTIDCHTCLLKQSVITTVLKLNSNNSIVSKCSCYRAVFALSLRLEGRTVLSVLSVYFADF